MTEMELRELVAGLVANALAERLPNRAAESEVMTAAEVADFLGVDLSTVYDYANRNVLPHQRLGRRKLFSRSALVAWLRSCKVATSRKG